MPQIMQLIKRISIKQLENRSIKMQILYTKICATVMKNYKQLIGLNFKNM